MTNPDSEYSVIDKIVVVCAALCNCCDSRCPHELNNYNTVKF